MARTVWQPGFGTEAGPGSGRGNGDVDRELGFARPVAARACFPRAEGKSPDMYIGIGTLIIIIILLIILL